MATKTKADKVSAPKTTIPRGERGYFAKGNRGKPKGTLSWVKRKVADAAREMFEEECPQQLRHLIRQNKNLAVKLRAIEILMDRAYGRAPLIVRASMDPNSPEGILLSIAGQTIPGFTPPDEDDES